MTRSLLAFSRQTPAEPRPLDLDIGLKDARELLAPLIPDSIEFSVDSPEDLDWVSADPTQLQQVIVNLVVNARDAMPDGGELSILASNRWIEPAAAIRLGLPKSGRYVEISVADSGIGIDEQVCSRIFDPFFTTKAPGKGTGLGLATAYGIVREGGGAIEVESRVGVGTTFRVLLPSVTSRVSLSVETSVYVREEPLDAGGGSPGRSWLPLSAPSKYL